MKKIDKYLSADAIDEMRNAICEANGNEVFFAGRLDNKNIVETVEILARGNETAVPAVSRLSESIDVIMHNHPSGLLKPSQNDLTISANFEKQGICSYIVNSEVDDIYVIIEPLEKDKLNALDKKKIGALLMPEGGLSQKLKSYEFREQQLEMLKHICDAFNNNNIALIEAGTGVGKTLAYLLPAIHWSIQNKERCVISTNTINLQEQLINKDIPILQSALGIEFKAVLLKGRNNYVCLRKVKEIEQEQELLIDADEDKEIKILLKWIKKTRDGSKSDLNFLPKYQVWEKIASESDTCSRAKCTYYKKCFVNIARHEAIKANIIITNHHLLFADFAVRRLSLSLSVLPPYQRLIMDEAHHIEEVATSYLGEGVTRTGIRRIFRRLYRMQKGDQPRGYLALLKFKLLALKKELKVNILDKIIEDLDQNVISKIDNLEQLNNSAMDVIVDLLRAAKPDENGEIKLRIVESVKQDPQWKDVEDKFSEMIFQTKRFCTHLNKAINGFDKIDIELSDIFFSLLIDIKAQSERLLFSCKVIDQILFSTDEDNIRWIECRHPHITRLKISPLQVNEIMRETVYDKLNTVVMTSATLSVAGLKNRNEFNFIMNRIGLDLVEKERVITIKLLAPFNYKQQVLLGIPTDIPEPGHESYKNELLQILLTSINVSGGRAFILFTSYGLLNYIFLRIENVLVEQGIIALKQGTESRYQLLEKFRQNETSVLFATDSFWEGVDVPGNALRLVIITKLPFQVPTEPVIEARVEAITKNGGNAFMEYSVPQAVIKLRQGFGRLIRNKSDSGLILVLDKRLIDKYYGRIFIDSLPETTLAKGTSSYVFAEMESFMFKH